MNRLDQIKERLGKATEGEWISGEFENSTLGVLTPKMKANADFIAHSKSDIQFILSEVERLRNVLEVYANQNDPIYKWNINGICSVAQAALKESNEAQ